MTIKFSPLTDNVPKHALTKMSVNFVSLCGAGINPLANVAFRKADDGDDDRDEFMKSGPTASEVHSNAPIGSKSKATKKKPAEPDDDEEGDESDGDEDDMKAKEKGDKKYVPFGKAGESTFTGVHTHTVSSASPLPDQGVHTMPDFKLPDGTPADVASYVADLEKNLIDTQDQLAKALDAKPGEASSVEKSDPAADLEALLAKADPAVAAFLKAQNDRIAKAEAEAESATAIATAIAKAAADRAALAKAEDLAPLGIETSEVAKTLAALRTTDPELAKSVESMLDSAKVAVEKGGLFDEVGVTAVAKSGTKAESVAAELRKADPTLTPEAALAKAFDENPSLYSDYLASKEV